MAKREEIEKLMEMVQRERILRHLQSLEGMRDTLLNPIAVRKAADYIAEEFRRNGLLVREDIFYALPTGWRKNRNIVGTLPAHPAGGPGRLRQESCFIIGAHYDTVPMSRGADDNASGVAVMLEVARVLSEGGVKPDVSLQFIGFAMEEYGFVGSSHYVKKAGKALYFKGMVSLECVGYTSSEKGSQAVPPGLPIPVPDTGNFLAVIGNRESKDMTTFFTDSAATYAPGLSVISHLVENNGWALPATRLSDHSPFWDAGYQALLVTDTAFLRNPHYHKGSDTVETLDLDFMTQVARAVVAFAAGVNGV